MITREEYLALANARYEELEALNKISSFYDYEKKFEEIWIDLGRKVFESNISSVPKDRRRKKNLNKVWLYINQQVAFIQ